MITTISVIVPTYNCGRFIVEALNSIFRQTVQPTQIIIVDDGSTDNTREIVRPLLAAHPSVQYIWQANAGVSVARNTGLAAARGDFITFLDADDRWLPTMLEKQLALLQSDKNIVSAFTNFVRFDEDTGTRIGDQFGCYGELSKAAKSPGPLPGSFILRGDAFCTLVEFVEIPSYTQVTMFRRELIAGVKFDPTLRLCQDLGFALQVFPRGIVAYNTEVLAEVRRHQANATKDFLSMSINKLNALQAVNNCSMNRKQRVAYRDRLVKAHLDAANFYYSKGYSDEALSHLKASLSIPGSWPRKLRGAARFAFKFARLSGKGKSGLQVNEN